jgi:hypothetical protein
VIKYGTELTQKFAESLIKANALFAMDMDMIASTDNEVTIMLADTGQRYDSTTRTVYIKHDIESMAHEVHHAAQHAALQIALAGSDSAVYGSEKGRLALEVSALATGAAAAGGNGTRKVKDMLPKYHAELDIYRCDGGVAAALDFAFKKKFMAYSQDRMLTLGILESACQ